MSREVRRVPVDFKHPIEHNPHWEFQRTIPPYGHPASRMHGPTERFVALCDDYPGTLASWEDDLRKLKAKEGRDWTFDVEYYLTGFKGRDDTEPIVHPYYLYDDAGEIDMQVQLRDADHLNELVVAKCEREKPNPDDYMPVFDVPEDELGWCLYQTVSEGTPVTPVFATAQELIEHLATVGQDWDQVPMRRASAEAIVSQGFTVGSMLMTGGVLYRSDMDADAIAALPRP
jgi:hypothetical protein